MIIDGIYFNCELSDILKELTTQLQINGIHLLGRQKELQNNIQVSCPYHNSGQENRPSAGIRKADGKFHCFTCHEAHSLPEMISYCFGYRDDVFGKFGKKWLLKNFSYIQVQQRPDMELDLDRHHKKAEPEYVPEAELDKYRYIHPYMYKRRLTDEIIELFDVGYDKATRCLTFPVRDITGNTLFVARRSVDRKYFRYPPGVVKPLYGLYELSQLEKMPSELIICESMLDALTCWVYGKYAVALNGLGNELQFTQLRKLPCREMVLATDNDKPGNDARDRIKAALPNKLVTQYVIPKPAKDINDLDLQGFESLEKIF